MEILSDLLQKVRATLPDSWFRSWLPILTLFTFILGGLCFGIGLWAFFSPSLVQAQPSKELKSFQSTGPKEPDLEADLSTITVDISGAVEKPAVYTLKSGSRLNELILQAGGFHNKVDKYFVSTQINLSKKLVDEEKIYIPFAGEESVKTLPISTKVSSSKESSLVSINSASQSELETLEGIGQVKAQQIIENRPFKALEGLLEKKIISSNLFAKIQNRITL